jgi:serine/threonine-protein kinase
MGTIHVGRLRGQEGFGRTVAIKRLHPHMARDPEFVAMFLEEARIAGRLEHPNVVSTIDVVSEGGELALVMDLVQGGDLAATNRVLWAREERMPPAIACAILCGVLEGLHHAHEARDERGRALDVVHRDVSPQNVLVGIDGVARIGDFGIAKAALRASSTRDGQIRGKIAYMPPEQILGLGVDRRADVYAAAVVLWETLAGRRLYEGDAMVLARKIVHATVEPPSAHARGLSPELDAIVLRGVARDPEARFETALAMAEALERAVRPASSREVAAWLGDRFAERASVQRAWLAALERAAVEAPCAPVPVWTAPPPAPDPHAPIEGAVTLPSPRERAPRRRLHRVTPLLVGLAAALALGSRLIAPSAAAGPARSPALARSTARGVEQRVVDPLARVSAAAAPTVGNAATRSCSPPYVVDGEGVHVPKPHCF